MMTTRALHQLLDDSASRFPDNVAVEETETGSISYAELARLSDRVWDHLLQLRVGPGDRVGICMRKSADAVASIFGIMKTGAADVPADPTAPATRNAFIFHDCAVKVLIVEARQAEALRLEFSQVAFAPEMVVLDGTGAGVPLTNALDRLDAVSPASSVPSAVPESSQLAYSLYTSGSTGRPKGVMLSYGNDQGLHKYTRHRAKEILFRESAALFAVDYRKQTVAMIKQNIEKYYELRGLEGRHRSIWNLHEKNRRRIV